MKNYLKKMKGHPRIHVRKPLSELFFAFLGAFLGIYGIWQINYYLGIQNNANIFLIGSFGASTVLIYGAPMSDFSQPRNLVGGHLISAITGVTIHILVPDSLTLSGALAVSLAIVGMLITHTTHPPGGATALIAVTGGDAVFNLGFQYVLTPVLIGVLIMLAVALIVNNFSTNEKRHYPQSWL